MLKTLRSIESTTQSGKGVVGVDGNSKAGNNGSKLDEYGIGDNKVDDEGDEEVGKKS